MQIWTFRFPAHNPLLASHHTENKWWSHIYTLWACKCYSILITCLDYFLSLPLRLFLMLFQSPLPPCYFFAWNVLPLDVYCILILESSRKTQLSQALDGPTLYSHGRDRARSASVGSDSPPWLTGASQQLTQNHQPASNLLCPRMEDPTSSPQEKDTKVGLARCYMTPTLNVNKGVDIESEIERYYCTRWLAQRRLWGFLISLFQAPGLFLCSQVGTEKLHARDCISQYKNAYFVLLILK